MDYTPKQVITMLREYNDDLNFYRTLLKEYEEESNVSHINATQYGIESTMPHTNTISNPTQKAAERLLIQDGALKRTKDKLDFIDKRSKRIHKNQHIVTFALRTQGYTCKYIASILNVKRTRVQNIINEIAQLMCKDDEEYRLYCKKKKINPVME
ncbi:hypothetical protein NW133_07290 [Staphylococcus pettenkoferi]|uniref:Uncharacterized protein n=1 Tax=Staphylococcus pettenkoferi TaxID=170573 RepID=A0ABT4BKY9_9STAP|nr:hypothetical protein [Staphylococcus pettenkoferi]MCY1583331.1 hypothetical protein [Staphylococcus pettenkoferi]